MHIGSWIFFSMNLGVVFRSLDHQCGAFRRHLDLMGYTVVSLPFWEWDQLTGNDERKEYLRGKLYIS
jgi:hypothetical protein